MDHQLYWNQEADRYDQLYTDSWSARENEHVRASLRWLADLEEPRVLDLGCGTGLGYELCRSTNPRVRYTGLDLAERMLRELNAKHPEVTTVLGSMDDLAHLPAAGFDAAITTFSSTSCVPSLRTVLGEVRRVLRPGGYLRVSALNRTALRRVLRMQFTTEESYQTRHGEDGDQSRTVTMYLHTRRALRAAAAAEGYEVVGIDSFGVLGGLWENPKLWALDRVLSQVAPFLAHTNDALLRLPEK